MASKKPARRTSVCLVYSHPLVWEEFKQLLTEKGYLVRGVRLEGRGPDRRKIELPAAKIYVLEGSGPSQLVASLIATVVEAAPGAPILVLSETFSEANSFPYLRQGAKGLLTYAEAREHLPRALQSVSSGGYWVPRAVLSRFVESVLTTVRGRVPAAGPSNLSQREQQVLDSLLENLANKEIASKLYISERTVKFHVSNLLAKFGVRRRADLILLCYQQRQSA